MLKRLILYFSLFLGFSVNVALGQCLTISTTQTDVSCFGGNDGQITLNITPGTSPNAQPPYSIDLYYFSGGLTPLASYSNVNFTTITFTPGNGSLNLLGADAFGIPATPAGDFYRIDVRSTGGPIICRNKSLLGIVISEPAILTGTVSSITPACIVGTGAIALDISGGTPLGGGPPNYTYTWTGPTAIASTIEDPVGLNAGTYSVTIDDAKGCQFTISNIIVLGAALADAGSDAMICSGSSTNLSASGGVSYSWSPATGLSASNIANPSASPLVTTTYTVTATDVNGCSDTDDVIVTVVPAPNAGIAASVNACNNNASFNLYTSLGGTPDIGGTWAQISGTARTITGNNVDLNGAAAGPYVFRYTVIAGPCPNASANVTVTVVAAPNAGLAAAVNACNTNGSFNLFGSLGGTPDVGGTWLQTGGAARTIIGNNVDLNGAAAGPYVFRYTVAAAPCANATADVTVTLIAAPNAGISSSVNACNNNASFSLFSSLGGTPNAGGTWLQTSGAARTITGNNVDLNGAIAGPYIFQYTVTGVAPCVNASANVTVTVVTAPNAGLAAAVNACNTNGSFNLFSSLGGTPDVGGTWLQTGGAARTITGNNVDLSGAAAGPYVFRYTVAAASCANATADVTVTLIAAPNAGISSSVNACNNNASFSLFSSLGGTPNAGGTWLQTSGAARTITGNNVDLNGAIAGPYIFQYTVTGVAPCVNASANVTVTVVSAPNAGITSSVNSCNDNASFNLFSSLGGTPDVGGTWIQISGSARTITGNNVDINGALAGAYSFRYTVGAAPCANITADVTVNVQSLTATISGTTAICQGQSVTLSVTLTGTGPWNIAYSDGSISTPISGIASSPHTFIVSPSVSTNYTLVSVSDVFCTSGSVSGGASITVNPVPGNQVSFGIDTWLGYVYTDQGSPAPPVSNIDYNATKYRGFINEADVSSLGFSTYNSPTDAFDLNLSNLIPLQGPNVCGSYFNDYSIRFKMTKNLAQGVYSFTLGADDGVRMLIDGVPVVLNPVGSFTTHAYTLFTSNPQCISAGSHDLVIEYFERGGFSRVSFDYQIASAPTVTTPLTACVNSPLPTLTANSADPLVVGYKWYSDAALLTLVASTQNYTPLPADLDMSVVGSTDFYVTSDYGCGQSLPAILTVDVVNSAVINVPAPPIQICQVGGIVDLTTLITATPAGTLTFTGTGITTSPNFDPTLVTATTTITATYSGVCSATPVNFDIDVVPVGVITPPSAILNVCQSSGSQLLTSLVSATPSGGTFTFAGTGVTGSNFDPAGLTGNIVITVDYSIGGSCAAPQQTIIYTVLTNAGLTASNTITCPTGNVDLLNLVTANPSGGTFTFLGATGITGNLFDPSSHAGTTVTITVNYIQGGCTASSSLDVMVKPIGDPTCGGPANCGAFTVIATNARPTCANKNDGTITLDVSGGTSPYIVTLSKLVAGIPTSPQALPGPGPTFTFVNLSPDDYQYSIQDAAANSCALPYTLLLQETVQAVASNFVDARCFNEPVGEAILTVTSGGTSPYAYSVDNGTNWIAFTSPMTVTNLPPSASPYSILVADDNTGLCSSQVMVTINNASSLPLDTLYVNRTISVPDLATGTMLIGVEESAQEPYEVKLELIKPLFPSQGFSLDWTPIVRNPLNLKFEYNVRNLFAGYYQLSLRDNLGCEKTYVVAIKVDTNLAIPNIFTPNGDGINDVFFIRNLPVETNVLITNRWGKEVFKAGDYQNDWGGGDTSDGLYYYRIVAADQVFTGWLEIQRGR